MPQQSLALNAPADRARVLWFEPWAEELTLPAGTTAELHANSRLAGQLAIEETDGRTVVYGWGGSTLRVMVDGRIVKSFDQPAPDFMDRASFDVLFAPPPGHGAAKPALVTPQLRAWWRFWEP